MAPETKTAVVRAEARKAREEARRILVRVGDEVSCGEEVRTGARLRTVLSPGVDIYTREAARDGRTAQRGATSSLWDCDGGRRG